MITTFAVLSGAPAARRPAKRSPITILGKRNPCIDFLMVIMGSGIVVLWARPHDGDDYDDSNSGVAQHGSHTPNNGLTETCSLGLLCTSLILDIHVMIN